MLISENYRAQQRKLHENPNYGVASVHFAPTVTAILNQTKIAELLDYGCGKGRLAESIRPGHKVMICQYDPGMPGIDEPPEPTDGLVTCIDVLEHIEPELLDNVLDDLQRVTLGLGFFTIHTGPAVKILPDGRNAHLIQEPYSWWLPKLWERFQIRNFSVMPNGFTVIVCPLPVTPA
jgi:hypothetical protein